MNDPTPIKRSEYLVPLSKEHHEGLLFVWKIRQGIKNGTDLYDIAAFVQWFWQNHLQEHFRQEEQFLIPFLPKENELVLRMLEEHLDIEALIHINENIPDSDILTQLGDKLHDHIRFEERVLFPFAETTIQSADMKKIYDQISKEKKECSKWENEFWMTKR